MVPPTVNELACQSLVVKSVREAGGFAFKLANRFLVGIPDLFLQHPSTGTGMWEVKLWKGKSIPKHDINLSVTEPQRRVLLDFMAAGGRGGVISFMRVGTTMSVVAHSTRYMVQREWPWAIPPFHVPLYRGVRGKVIMGELERAIHE